jgi:hypothetical protein
VPDPDRLLGEVEKHLVTALGPDSGRATVSFLGADPVEVLRFGPDAAGLVRYATLGMSRTPMADPAADVVAADGPRAELVLSVHGGQDSALRRLAVLASTPVMEGVVVSPGAGLDLGEPLWEGGRFTAVLVGESGGLVPDLPVGDDREPVRFLPLLPMTPNEAAWKRVHGAAALEERWLAQQLDLRDPARPEADLS